MKLLKLLNINIFGFLGFGYHNKIETFLIFIMICYSQSNLPRYKEIIHNMQSQMQDASQPVSSDTLQTQHQKDDEQITTLCDLRDTNSDIFVQHNLKYTFDGFHIYHKHFDVLTTRFSSLTFKENYDYRQQLMNEKNKSNLCVYGVKTRISHEINGYGKFLFVLEMNNTINKIMGIGIIKCTLDKIQTRKIYSDERFNTYIYSSIYYAPILKRLCDKKDYYLNDDKFKKWTYDYEENIHPEFIQYLETVIEPLCFKGKSHLKRGESFSRMPMKFMSIKMFVMLISLFISINPNDFNTNVMKKKFNYNL